MPGPSVLPPESPHPDLRVSSLEADEQARRKSAITFPKAPRFDAFELRVVVPGAEHSGAMTPVAPLAAGGVLGATTPSGLGSPLRSTRSRTVSPDKMYDIGNTLADKIASPTFRNTVPAARTGHISMNLTSPCDPRQQHVHPAARPEVGPGTYDVDPLADCTTGTPVLSPGQSHHMMALWKDPSRPSPAFRSPERGATAFEVNEAKARNGGGHKMLPPDFAVWTARGLYTAKGPRAIESERWGRNAREPRPPAASMPQEMFDPQVGMDGLPSTCTAYAADKGTPAYKAAFGSGLPRLVALPAGAKPDTRTVAGLGGAVSMTGPGLGPGAYTSLEAPRFRSFNTAYNTAPEYYSLAQGAPPPTALAHNGSASPERSSPTHRTGSPTRAMSPMRGAQLAASGAMGGVLHAGSGPVSPVMRQRPRTAASVASTDVFGSAPPHGITLLTGPSPVTSPLHSARRGSVDTGLGGWSRNASDVGVAHVHASQHQGGLGEEADPDWVIHQAVVDMQRVGVRELRGGATRTALASPPTGAAAAAQFGEVAAWAGQGVHGTSSLPLSPTSLPASPAWALELAAACGPPHTVLILPGSGLPHTLSAPPSPSFRHARMPPHTPMPAACPAYPVSRPHTSGRASHGGWAGHARADGGPVHEAAVSAAAAYGVSLVPPPTAPAQFNQLTFLRRAIPHSALMRGQLRALNDLRSARAAVRAAEGADGS